MLLRALAFVGVSSPTSESESESKSCPNGPGDAGGGMLPSLFKKLALPLGGGGLGGLRLIVDSSSVLSCVETSEDDNVESSDDEMFEEVSSLLL